VSDRLASSSLDTALLPPCSHVHLCVGVISLFYGNLQYAKQLVGKIATIGLSVNGSGHFFPHARLPQCYAWLLLHSLQALNGSSQPAPPALPTLRGASSGMPVPATQSLGTCHCLPWLYPKRRPAGCSGQPDECCR